MNRSFLILMLCIIFPSLLSRADEVVFEDGATDDLSPLLSPSANQQTIAKNPLEVQFGFSKLHYYDKAVKEVKLTAQAKKSSGIPLFAVKEAQADLIPINLATNSFFRIYNTIQQASGLTDIRPVITDNIFNGLQNKITSGVSQYTVLKMVQEFRPEKVKIIDSRVEGKLAEFAVTGQSPFGPVQGLVNLVQSENEWKLDNEEWFSGDKTPTKADAVTMALGQPSSDPNVNASTNLFLDSFPQYKFNRNILALRHAHTDIRKRSFMFIFFMDRPDSQQKKFYTGDLTTENQDQQRPRMHILWTGPNKMMAEQKIIKNEYPVDVSIANDDDGYAPGELNLLLPKKKPNGVTASLMWTF